MGIVCAGTQQLPYGFAFQKLVIALRSRKVPLAQQTRFELMESCFADGWTWQRLPTAIAKRLVHICGEGGTNVFYWSGPCASRLDLQTLVRSQQSVVAGVRRFENGKREVYYKR